MAKDDENRSLARTLSVGDVVSLGLNGVIGSGIFLLPGIAAEEMGPAALLPLIFAGVLCFLIALCFAEVGSRFSGTGGAYLYAREAFGGFVGFSVGWMTWCVRIVSWAALANAFAVAFLSLFGPEVHPALDEIVVVLVLVGLSVINWRGAKIGAVVTNVFTVAKLVPLALFVVAGLFFIDGGRFEPFAPEGYGGFANTTLVLLWAFAGFEVLAVPAGEMSNPGRAVPLAFLVVMGTVTLVYVGVLSIAIGTYDGLAGSDNPVAESAQAFLGPVGGTIVAIGIAISIFGTNAGSALITPRCLYAIAEQKQMPAVLARVHAHYRTPTIAIVISTSLSLAIGLSGSFEELAVISVVARFLQYLPTCIAVLVFRHRDRVAGDTSAKFRLPLGPTIPILATLLCLGLLTQAEPMRLLAGAGAFAISIPLYFLFRARGRPDGDPKSEDPGPAG